MKQRELAAVARYSEIKSVLSPKNRATTYDSVSNLHCFIIQATVTYLSIYDVVIRKSTSDINECQIHEAEDALAPHLNNQFDLIRFKWKKTVKIPLTNSVTKAIATTKMGIRRICISINQCQLKLERIQRKTAAHQ
jgi:hypothetical protein